MVSDEKAMTKDEMQWLYTIDREVATDSPYVATDSRVFLLGVARTMAPKVDGGRAEE